MILMVLRYLEIPESSEMFAVPIGGLKNSAASKIIRKDS